jgi:hypothetical protein
MSTEFLTELFGFEEKTDPETSLRCKLSVFTTNKVTGYVHTMPDRKGVLITADFVPYFIPADICTFHSLGMGDEIEAKVGYSYELARYVVTEIVKLHKSGYDELSPVQREDMRLGTTILHRTDNDADHIKTVKDIAGTYPENSIKIVLLFDGKKENYDLLLQDKTIAELYATKLSYSNRDKITVCLLAFFHAKKLAHENNVVLIIDSFDKMFHTYNCCIRKNGELNPEHISLGAMTDFESIICSGKSVESGSLTIIGLYKSGITPISKYVEERLEQICDKVI